MKLLNRAGLAVLGALLLPSGASAAAPAYVAGTTNLRAGPGTEYPVVARIGGGSRVTVHGCIRGYDWCDATIRGFRGWVTAERLEFVHRGRRVLVPQYYRDFGAPVVSFNFDYWDRYYTDRPFFRERGRWDRNWRGRDGDDRDRRGRNGRRGDQDYRVDRGDDDGDRRGRNGRRGDQDYRVDRGGDDGDRRGRNGRRGGQEDRVERRPGPESEETRFNRAVDDIRRNGLPAQLGQAGATAAGAAEGGAEAGECFVRNGREICR